MISVIVPVYKTEKYLKRCIESILNQTFTDFEIILVNDCSPDDSEDIVFQFLKNDKRITYIKNDHNLGCEKSRIKALNQCNGEFVTFVDSDDYVATDFLSSLMNPIMNDMDLDSVIVQSKKVFSQSLDYKKTVSANGKRKTKCLDGENILNQFFGKDNIMKMGAAKVFKKSILLQAFQAVPDDVPHKVSDDIMFTYQYYKRSAKVLINYVEAYFYEQSNVSICRSMSEKSLDNISVWDFIFEDYKSSFPKEAPSKVSYALLLSLRYTLYKVYKSDNLKLSKKKICVIKNILKKAGIKQRIRYLPLYCETALLVCLNRFKRV